MNMVRYDPATDQVLLESPSVVGHWVEPDLTNPAHVEAMHQAALYVGPAPGPAHGLPAVLEPGTPARRRGGSLGVPRLRQRVAGARGPPDEGRAVKQPPRPWTPADLAVLGMASAMLANRPQSYVVAWGARQLDRSKKSVHDAMLYRGYLWRKGP